MIRSITLAIALLSASFTLYALDPSGSQATGGVLDEPLLNPNTPAPGEVAPAAVPAVIDLSNDPNVYSPDPATQQAAVQDAVDAEIEVLESLPIAEVEVLAESGERAAQIVLATDFAKEAQSLAGIPPAANQAASDAARWYALAARRGFPGAVSLDYAGVSIYPIRVQRSAL